MYNSLLLFIKKNFIWKININSKSFLYIYMCTSCKIFLFTELIEWKLKLFSSENFLTLTIILIVKRVIVWIVFHSTANQKVSSNKWEMQVGCICIRSSSREGVKVNNRITLSFLPNCSTPRNRIVIVWFSLALDWHLTFNSK